MASIRELQARFTGDAALLKRAFREIQQEAARLGPAVNRSTTVANRSMDGLGTNAGRLRTALREAGNVPAFDELNRSAEQAQREIEQTGRVSAETMARLEASVSGAGDHFDTLGADARQGFSDVERAINEVRGEMDQLNAADLTRLRQEAERAQRELDQLADAAQDAEQQMDEIDGGGLDEAADSAGGLGDVLGSLGGASTGVIGAVGAGFAALTGIVGGFVAAGAGIYGFIKSSDELKIATNALQTQTGATAEEIDGMRDSLVNIYGNNFGDDYRDIADSMATVQQQTNLSGEALEQFTQNALLLRDTFEYDVAESTKAASILMKQFGLDGEESMALIASGTQNGLNYADDLLDTIGEYSPYYEAAGFSAEEMFGMFKNAQEAGVFNLDYAADAFKEFGIIMLEEGDKATDALSSIGLPAEKLRTDFAKGGESARAAFQTIAEKLGTIKDPLDRNAAGVELFGTKFEDLGAEAVIAMSQANTSITGTTDVLEELNEVKYDSVSEAIAGVGRKLVAHILIPLQDRIMPGVNDSINKFTGYIGTAAEAIGAFIRGDESAQDVLMSYGLDPAQFMPLIGAIDKAQAGFARFQEGTGRAMGSIAAAVKRGLIDLWPIAVNAITVAVAFISNNLAALTSYWQRNGETISATLRKITDTIKTVFIAVWPSVRAAISAVVRFIGDSVRKIAEFWEENGAQILEAVGNIFNGIMAVIKFVMPLVLAIIRSVWGNIKGVITGALDIIMGVVKIFSGLFTGDFSKMWEGVKQLFSGAVKFIWNFIQLSFYGKILGGAKVFVLSFRTFFVNMWQAIVKLFQGNVTAAWNIIRAAWTGIFNTTKSTFTNVVNFFKNTWASIKSITSGLINAMKLIFSNGFQTLRNTAVNIFLNLYRTLSTTMTNLRTGISDRIRATVDFARNAWNGLKTNTVNTFRDIYNAVKGRFTDIVDAAKALPGRIGDGIRLMASKVTSGVTSLINSMARTLGKGINGVIGGINSVLDKIGVNTEIKPWTVPQWAKGTPAGGHPGGLAMVNDGTGDNAGPELIRLPNGKTGTLPGANVVTSLPKGTQILSAKKTRSLLAGIPAYAWGTDVFEGAKNLYQKGKEKVSAGVSKLKDWTVDVFKYLKNPSGLLDLALQKLGVELPSGNGFVASMAKGAVKQVKNGAINLIKKSLEGFGADGGVGGAVNFGGRFRKTSSYGYRIHPVTGVRTFHQGDDWGAPAGTPIPNQAAGRVVQAGYHPLRGNYVRIKSGNYERIYQHNTRNMVGVGDMVRVGQTVGTVGSTGRSTGPHLHFELLHNGRNIRPTALSGKNVGGKGGDEEATGRGLGSSLYSVGKKAAALMRTYGSPVESYFDELALTGNPLNKMAGNVPKDIRLAMMNIGHRLADLQGFENGGVASGKLGAQLAWLTEGGFAESIISHDPSKKASQQALWQQTGDMLGFNRQEPFSAEATQLLMRIARAVEMGHSLYLDSEQVAEILRDPMTKLQELDGEIRKIYKR